MDAECTCGHGGSRHDGEQPYPCYDCDCRAFTDRRTAPEPSSADKEGSERPNPTSGEKAPAAGGGEALLREDIYVAALSTLELLEELEADPTKDRPAFAAIAARHLRRAARVLADEGGKE